ncbi:glycoside hydrolase family 43 protein [Sphingobacterium suaedae]|uniref:Glycoside hydrolase family 43 protein n=1 Tax=Sphingobacterium suaedae TaxID=1686402 RepID=A0ABW5KMK6_9SPHI
MAGALLTLLLVGYRSAPVREAVCHQDLAGITLADPTIFNFQGTFYLYGTDGQDPNSGFRVYTSTDLVDWGTPAGNKDGFALKAQDVFGEKGFWAPQVWQDGDSFYMAYTANENISIAVSTSPLGPFVQSTEKPLFPDGKQIDPFVFHDTDGKLYIYYVKLHQGNRIYVAQLADDYASIVAGTEKECVHATLRWENVDDADWPVTEGPTVIKKGDWYYLFYSANDFRNPKYAVGAAVAKHPAGPWKKRTDGPLLSQHNTGWAGTGHGDVFFANDQYYYVCHTHFSASKVGPRRTALIQMDFNSHVDGHQAPVFKGDSFRFLK